MINIAKLLKDAPKGMKLYSPLFGEVKFKYINGSKFGIIVEDSEECCRSFDKYGRYFTIYNNAECLLFPSKEVHTWEGWKLPNKSAFKVDEWIIFDKTFTIPVQIIEINQKNGIYVCKSIEGICGNFKITKTDKDYHLWSIADAKDGDVLVTDNGWTCIFKAFDGCVFSSYCFMDSQKWFCEVGAEGHTLDSRINGNIHPATKEQRILFFKKMQEAGYQWYAGEKELRKIQSHYDIANFHAGMPVLVRADNNCRWDYSVFSRVVDNEYWHFAVCNGVCFTQCIPFNEETKHLLGTTDPCDEQYINW